MEISPVEIDEALVIEDDDISDDEDDDHDDVCYLVLLLHWLRFFTSSAISISFKFSLCYFAFLIAFLCSSGLTLF